MTNIWGFVLQTFTASLVALVLLFLHGACEKKFSPRWYSWLWGLLALRILIPVSVGRQYLFLSSSLWIETIKGMVERQLSSTFSGEYLPIVLRHPFPQLSGQAPTSVTDWLFLVYVAGVVVTLLYYLIGYLRLRYSLRHGVLVNAATAAEIAALAAENQLKTCRAIRVAGIASPFVYGIFRQCLVLPQDWVLDEKVMLHELLHVKYRDPLQSMGWALLLSLHWCNPILRLMARTIRMDLEALCDQRVLERLSGEERRDYGRILLSMVDERNPSRPGTSCIANGGRQIGTRIASIARFKKYDRGLGIFVVGLSAILALPLLLGMRDEGLINPNTYDNRPWSFERYMASARITRCSTMAGALDTYAKGLMRNHGLYRAAAAPLSEQGALLDEMEVEWARTNISNDFRLNGGLSGIAQEEGYAIYDLAPDGADAYRATLVFFRPTEVGSEDEILRIKHNWETGYYVAPYEGEGELILVPVRVWKEDAWVVSAAGERTVQPVAEHRLLTQYGALLAGHGKRFVGESSYGSIELTSQIVASVENQGPQNGSKRSGSGIYVELFNQFDDRPKTSADFAFMNTMLEQRYTLPLGVEHAPQSAVTILIQPRFGSELDDEAYFYSPYENQVEDFSDSLAGKRQMSHNSTNGASWLRYTLPTEPAMIDLSWESSISYAETVYLGGHPAQGNQEAPVEYLAQIYWDDVYKDTITLTEVREHGK